MTFSSIKDIQQYISELVSDKIDAGLIVRIQWVTQEILTDFDDIEGDHKDFFLIAARHFITDQVKRCIKRFEPTQDDSAEQLVLEGFKHLQKAYPVDRDGERQIVPVDMLTDEELEARADEYDAMAAGCLRHAIEIREYMASRMNAQREA